MSRIPELDGDLPGLIGSPDLSVWVAVLLIQSMPYAAAVRGVAGERARPAVPAWIGEAGAHAAIEPRRCRRFPRVTAQPGQNPASLRSMARRRT